MSTQEQEQLERRWICERCNYEDDYPIEYQSLECPWCDNGTQMITLTEYIKIHGSSD